MGKIYVSIDDGHPLDLKIAEILYKKGIKAIFYIPIKNCEGRKVLKPKEIYELSKNFEIGAHTFNHKDVTKLSYSEAESEIMSGKKALEEIIGRRIYAFCPPKGKYNQETLRLARKCGYKSLRSARILNFNSQKKGFVINPNFHLYPHSFLEDLGNIIKAKDYYSLGKRVKNWSLSHLELLNTLKASLISTHVWLHSWEIEEQGLWSAVKNL